MCYLYWHWGVTTAVFRSLRYSVSRYYLTHLLSWKDSRHFAYSSLSLSPLYHLFLLHSPTLSPLWRWWYLFDHCVSSCLRNLIRVIAMYSLHTPSHLLPHPSPPDLSLSVLLVVQDYLSYDDDDLFLFKKPFSLCFLINSTLTFPVASLWFSSLCTRVSKSAIL